MFEIGSSLREARVRQHLEFAEVEQATKIRAKYLRALEEERFDTLPAPTYVKGFLRAYADYLGLDGELYVDEYNSRYVAAEEELVQPRPRRAPMRPRAQPRLERNAVILALVAIAAVTALVIAAWRFGGGDEQEAAFTGLATPPKAQPTVAKKQVPRVRLVLTATAGNSWLQVHLGSATGRPLYQGTLEQGQTQRFVAGRLWLKVGNPGVLEVRLNRRPVKLPRGEVLVTPEGARPATGA